MRPRHIVGAGAGEIAVDLADNVGIEGPGEGVRIVDLRYTHRNLNGAALGQVLRTGWRRKGLTRDLASPHVSCACRHAQQRAVAHELSARDQAVGKLLLQLWYPNMFLI